MGGHTDPHSIPGIYNFYYFWKASLRSRTFLRHASWAVAVEWFLLMKAAKNRVSIFSPGVGEKSTCGVFLSENVHTGVSFSSPQCLITDPAVGLWVSALRSQKHPVAAAPQHTSLGTFRPRSPVLANCPSLRLLASIHANLSVCG